MSTLKEYGGLAVAAGAAVLVLGYLARRSAEQAAAAFIDTTKAIGEGIGSKLYEFNHPEGKAALMTWYVTFPDGSVRAVDSVTVDRNGFFNYWRDGSVWKLATTADGRKYAIASSAAAKMLWSTVKFSPIASVLWPEVRQ